jgi:hypothetical protein
MRSFKTVIIAVSFVALSAAALAFHVGVARADDTCALTAADFDKIAAVQSDPSLTANQEMAQELAVRKQLLTQTITCAQAEVLLLQNTLTSATSTDGTKNIQSRLLSDLNDAANFYNIESVKLNGAGIWGTKTIAREIIAWRAGTYVPLEGEINNYLLWTQNQPLFATAQSRMDDTQQAVSFLESSSANSDLQNAFNAAYASFQTAKTENAGAKNALAQSLSPDQSLALIKQSLDSLSDTYQGFFAVSKAIKAILPH